MVAKIALKHNTISARTDSNTATNFEIVFAAVSQAGLLAGAHDIFVAVDVGNNLAVADERLVSCERQGNREQIHEYMLLSIDII